MLKKFWIVTNDGKDTNHAVTEKVKELLEIAGRSCILCEKMQRKYYQGTDSGHDRLCNRDWR